MDKFWCVLALTALCVNAVPLESDGVSTRIINGNEATYDQFPYAVSLQTTTAGVHSCGGVLVTLQHVLTAATCVTETLANGTIVVKNTSTYRIFGGAASLSNSTAERVRDIANFTVHPGYTSAPAYRHDIAVITLTAPFAGGTVTPLALPAADFNPADFTPCTVAGWGAVAGNTPNVMSPVLRYANKYVYNQNLCMLVFNTNPTSANVFPTNVCAASDDMLTASCNGDNGNALVCDDTLTGVSFYGSSCTPSALPELYTRVSNYTTWIRSVTSAGGPGFTPGLFMLSLLTVSQVVFAKVVS
ncbi:trypsin 3A1-like [Pectinophora gossypiella]|uniref:Peptidase S1 domain-containing protein n=1 Tax=Pectinophora gossypiella TaxID=13191 RepID=A0A1E1WN59_PECGO|nr:trypsin 3A1-like [Pectinophora gossypiella]